MPSAVRAQWEVGFGIRAATNSLGPGHLQSNCFDVVTDDVKIKSENQRQSLLVLEGIEGAFETSSLSVFLARSVFAFAGMRMCACTCVCVHMYTHLHAPVHVHAHIRVSTHVCVCEYPSAFV